MRHRKFLIVSEVVPFPLDEGFKNIVYHVIEAMKTREDTHIALNTSRFTYSLDVERIKFNKLLLSNRLRLLFEKYWPEIVLYIPEASCTFNSFIRARILKLLSRRSKVVILALQHREYLFFYEWLLNSFRPDLLLLLSNMDKSFFEKRNFNVKVLPPAVDKERFCEISGDLKVALRRKYNIPFDKTIVTHVGHINTNRNLECFIDIQKMDNIQVVIIGSTTTQTDERLEYSLKSQGIIIIDSYLSKIQEIYQLSDIYAFPVLRPDAAIEMPLSVLEALACNLPVVTTRFGVLPYYFSEDANFKYFDTAAELLKSIREIDATDIRNDKKIEHFGWDVFIDELIVACEGSDKKI